jgi:hypothetical protein
VKATRCSVVIATAVTATVLGLPVVAAEDEIPFGGGAGIVVDGSYCTLTTIGHDNTGELVGFTAAHCGGPGAQVVAESAQERGPLGSVVAANDGLDYSVIKFDAAKVAPTAHFDGFAINGIGPDPDFHQPECKLGAATGDYCSGNSSLPGPGPRMWMQGLFQPGDDGGPVTSDDLLIAMIIGGRFGFPPVGLASTVPRTHLLTFSAILGDVNAHGGPGAGFTPIPA